MSRPRDERAISVLRAIACIGVYAGLLVPAVYLPMVFFPLVFPKIIFLQFMIGVTFPAYLCLAWLEPRFRPPRSAIYAAILFHIAAITVSTVLSMDSHRSWWGEQERMGGQFGLLHFVAWLTMTIGLFKRWDEWSRLLRFEVVVAVIMAIVALLQIPYPELLGFHSESRVSGLLGNPIFMAGYQLFNLSFIALLFVKTAEKRERIWYGVALALCFAALLAAQSRGGMAGFAAVVVSFGLYYGSKSENRRAVRGSLYGIVSILVVLALPFVFRTSSIVTSSEALSRIVNMSDALAVRMIVWSMAWQGILKRPFAGWGYDTFYIVANREYDPTLLEYGYYDTWFDRAHNIVLDTLVTTGALGLFAVVLLFAVTLLLLSRAQAKGWIDLPTAAILISMAIGYFVQNLSAFDHPAEMSMIYLMFGLAISGSSAQFEMPEEGEGDSPAPIYAGFWLVPWIGLAIVQTAFLVGIWKFSILSIQASIWSRQGNVLLQKGEIESGYRFLKRAALLATPYGEEQTYYLSRNLIGLAKAGTLEGHAGWLEMYDFNRELNQRQLELHPGNTQKVLIFARYVQELIPFLPEERREKETQLALSLYQHAIETSPERQHIYFGLGQFHLDRDDPERALEAFEAALSFNENIGESWWRVGRLKWSDMNDSGGAEDILNALDASTPYRFRRAGEALIVAEIARLEGREDLLDDVMTRIPSLRGGSADLFLGIAREFERADRIEDRDRILAVLARSGSRMKAMLGAVRAGSVTTIDESIGRFESGVELRPETSGTGPMEENGPEASPVHADDRKAL